MKGRKTFSIAFFLLSILLLFSENLPAQRKEAKYPPYQVKSILLRRIPRHFEWPPGSPVNKPNTPFILSVIGQNPFENWLDDLFSRKEIKKKKVEVRYINKVEEIDDTHLLFIARTSRKELNRILDYTSNRPILTVSDTEDYADRGVNVNIIPTEQSTFKLEINEATVRRAGLAIKQTMFKDKVEVIKSYDEALEKAMALERLASESSWPDTAMAPADSSFKIVVLGANPFGSNLSRVFRRKKIHDKRVNIRFVPTVQTVGTAHLLFISNNKSNQLAGILTNFKNKPVLLVADTKGFATRGVHVNFFVDVNVQAEINVSALMGSGVSINRDYINMSRRVTGK